jgi:hypothetical protein
LTFLELKLDDGNRVSGTTIWRQGRPENRYEHRAAIKSGSFDAATGAIKLEGDGRRPDGATVAYVIEGTIEKDTISGTYKIGEDSGPFTFKRQ